MVVGQTTLGSPWVFKLTHRTGKPVLMVVWVRAHARDALSLELLRAVKDVSPDVSEVDATIPSSQLNL